MALWMAALGPPAGKGRSVNIPTPRTDGRRRDGTRRRWRGPWREFSVLVDGSGSPESDWLAKGRHDRHEATTFGCSSAPTTTREKPGETALSFVPWPYSQPHQVSEVNSLWLIEEGRQGNSAKSLCNFGIKSGSKGRASWVPGLIAGARRWAAPARGADRCWDPPGCPGKSPRGRSSGTKRLI